MTDRVRYQMPLGPVGRIVHALWTQRTLERIFDYRFQKIGELLGGLMSNVELQMTNE
jgi:ligand-binding SRPBCC domain-containing protein